MAALAEEIADTRPHLVGLQEVTVLRLQHPSDFVLGGMEPATDVIADFEATLLSELVARGARLPDRGSDRECRHRATDVR